MKNNNLIHKEIIRYVLLLSGIVVILLGFFVFNAIKKYQAQIAKEKEMKKIIVPYYDEKSFKRPAFLPTPVATREALLIPVKIPIIMYHYIEYVKDQGDFIRKRLDIVPSTFEKQLKELQEAGYDSYFVKDVPDILSGKIHYSPKSIILSFDDGYEDFYTDAFPLLKKYHMQATIYVIYNFIGRRGFLTKQQIQELLDSGLIEVGDHTFDHLYLKSLPAATVKKQVMDSKKKFEEDFHIKIATFAYPYGAMSPTAIADVKEAGYTAAVSVISGTMQSEENLFYLSRIRPGLLGNNVPQSIEAMKK